jgi:hypothetical protein
MCLRIRPWVAVIGGLAFAYSTTFPQFITAGHDTQMLALAYAPAVLGGVILLFDKKYISGFIMTTLFAGLQVAMGHQQVSYYMFLVIGIMVLFFLIQCFRSGKAAPQLKATGLVAAAALLGIMINAVSLITVYDYSKESKRGGQLVMDKKQNTQDVMEGDKKLTTNNTLGIDLSEFPEQYKKQALVSTAFAISEPVMLQSARVAYLLVLTKVGASLPGYDAVDSRLIAEARLHKTAFGEKGIINDASETGGWPVYQYTKAPADTDQDGMPDEWELKNGLNPKLASDNNSYRLSKAYTNIEVYINGLVK